MSQDPYLLRTWQYSSSGPRTLIIVLCVSVEYTKSQDQYLVYLAVQ